MHLRDNTILQGGRYRIVRFINSGGFGCTYEAEHVMLGKRVAIKEFFVDMFCNRDADSSGVTVSTTGNVEVVSRLRKKFIKEAQAIFALHQPSPQPGIVRVIDFFEENGTAYYVMNYIEGLSLSQILKQRGPLSESEAVEYICQVADALEFVHDKGVLHLDIKPGNIMIDANNNAILIDFGASKCCDSDTGEVTATLMGMNTPGYAPLEQAPGCFTKFSASTDIYALGATLYKLLTGNTPPQANALAGGEIKLEPLPLTVSLPVRNAVYAAMQPKRLNRPQSIAEFKRVLNRQPELISIDEGEDEFVPKLPPLPPSGKSTSVTTPFNKNKPQDRGKSGKLGVVLAIVFGVAAMMTVFFIGLVFFASRGGGYESYPYYDADTLGIEEDYPYAYMLDSVAVCDSCCVDSVVGYYDYYDDIYVK